MSDQPMTSTITLPAHMQALTLSESGFASTATGPYVETLEPYLSLETVTVPSPGPGQVVVRMRLSVVNPSDIHFVKGEYGLPRVAGGTAGFEGCGTVVAVGEGADALLGKRVAMIASQKGTGLWAEYVLSDTQSCVPVPDAIRDEDAAAFFVNPLTAVGLVSLAEEARDQAGSGGLVISAAGSQLGKLMLGLAKDRDIPTIALVRRAEQVDTLRELGANHVLVTTEGDFASSFAASAKSLKPRIFVDAVADAISSQVFFAMPARSRWVIYGLLDTAPTVLDQLGQLIFMGKRIEGYWLTQWLGEISKETRDLAFKEVFTRFSAGTWSTVVRETIPLADVIAQLPGALENTGDGKIMIRGEI